MEPFISFRDVTKIYHTGEVDTVALGGVSFEVKEGPRKEYDQGDPAKLRTDMDEKSDGEIGGAVNACFWEKINNSLNAYAKNLTLSDFAAQCRDSGGKWDMYVI